MGGWVDTRTGLDGSGKYRPPPGFDHRTVQPVASRCTACAIPAHNNNNNNNSPLMKPLSFSLHNWLKPPVNSLLLGPNILLSTPFWNAVGSYSSLTHLTLVLGRYNAKKLCILTTQRLYNTYFPQFSQYRETTLLHSFLRLDFLTEARCVLCSCTWRPHSLLVLSVHPEGPATSQPDQGFPWFLSALK